MIFKITVDVDSSAKNPAAEAQKILAVAMQGILLVYASRIEALGSGVYLPYGGYSINKCVQLNDVQTVESQKLFSRLFEVPLD